jgi:tetratricopeptide (TPR) repeat protein
VPFVAVLTVLGAWAERTREKKQQPSPPEAHVNTKVEHSSNAQAIGQLGEGGLVIGPGASLTSPVFNFGGQKIDGRELLRDRTSGSDGVLVVGDVPQEPAAFQQRVSLLGMLDRESEPRLSVVYAVTGIRGVGKTQVAAAYARRRISDRWRLVAWIDATDTASVLAGLAQVAAAAGIGVPGADAADLAAGVRHWLEADGKRRLIVFDNAVDLDGLRPFLPAGGAAQVVITSNRQAIAGMGTGVPVDVFSAEEALAFLAERTGLHDAAGGQELAHELGFLPLGLAQAAALIAREHLGYGTYLGRLRALSVADYLGRVEGDTYPHPTAEAIVLSLRSVEEADTSGRCGEVMGLVSVLAETGVSRRLLHLAASGVHSGEDEDLARVDAAVGVLADASLVGFSVDDAVVAHRLVMRVARERLAADGGLTSAVAEALIALSRFGEGMEEPWRDPAGVRELAGHVSALAGYTQGRLNADVATNLLLLRLGTVYLLNALGDSTGQVITAAEPIAVECEQVLGADHPSTLHARSNLAYAYQLAGRTAEAIPLYEQTLADRERILGAYHPDTLLTRNNLAAAYQAVGRTAEAIPLYEQTLADRERILGAYEPDTLSSRNNLASAYQAAGRTPEAIQLLERTVADSERILGGAHPDTLGSRNNLAEAYRLAGRTADAILLLERTLADREQVTDKDHPETLGCRNNLALAYMAAGRTAEAIQLLERNLADRERVMGANHPDTLGARNNLAGAYRDAGRTAEAIPLLEHTLAESKRALGTAHPYFFRTSVNLAGAYQAMGRVDEAIPLLERALTDVEQQLGVLHPDTLICRNNLAGAYRAVGRKAEAIPLLERTVAESEQVVGTDHPDTLTCRNNLASAYQDVGRLAEAIPLFERTLTDRERVLGTQHPGTLASRNNLAGAYLDAGRAGEAIPLLRRTLIDAELVLGAEHPSTNVVRGNLTALTRLRASGDGPA